MIQTDVHTKDTFLENAHRDTHPILESIYRNVNICEKYEYV